jgi:hypothetical protein
MNEILTKVGLSLACVMAVLIIVLASVKIYGEIKGATKCAYCHGTITDDADYVCMTDGRRMHTGCYMRSIREDINEK